MKCNYIICAAGKGERFRKLLPTTAKPLIKINGKSSLELSLMSLPIASGDAITIITHAHHGVKSALYNNIVSSYPFNKINWIETDIYTSGQLKTAFFAKPFVTKDESVAIFNCDTYFQDSGLYTLMQDVKVDGIIPCGEAEGESWSFCKTDANGFVTEVAEKRRISNKASIGFYFFRDSELFFKLSQDYITDYSNKGEHYVIPLYDFYIKMGKKITAPMVQNFRPMGTPEQLKEFWNIDEEALVKTNTTSTKVIVCDIDNTITIEKSDEPSIPYAEKYPNYKVIEKLREYKKLGFQIILYSSRRMKTHKSNEALAIGEIGETTLNWLRRFEVPFDGIRFGKPYCEDGFIVDDKAIRPKEFIELSHDEIKTLTSYEFKYDPREK
jgi:capsule biosynthesis phosphatase